MSDQVQRHKRTQMEVQVEVMDEDSKNYEGTIGNLSISGALVLCENSPAVGKAIKTILELKKEDLKLQVTGKVVRQDSNGFAIQFNTIQSEDYRTLVRIVTIANRSV